MKSIIPVLLLISSFSYGQYKIQNNPFSFKGITASFGGVDYNTKFNSKDYYFGLDVFEKYKNNYTLDSGINRFHRGYLRGLINLNLNLKLNGFRKFDYFSIGFNSSLNEINASYYHWYFIRQYNPNDTTNYKMIEGLDADFRKTFLLNSFSFGYNIASKNFLKLFKANVGINGQLGILVMKWSYYSFEETTYSSNKNNIESSTKNESHYFESSESGDIKFTGFVDLNAGLEFLPFKKFSAEIKWFGGIGKLLPVDKQSWSSRIGVNIGVNYYLGN